MNVCTDTGLEPYKEYYYYVQTLDFVDGFWGYGADSQIVSAKTGLAVPGNVTVAADGANYYGMRIRWDVTQGATFYGIMRAVSGTGNFEWIGMTYALSLIHI